MIRQPTTLAVFVLCTFTSLLTSSTHSIYMDEEDHDVHQIITPLNLSIDYDEFNETTTMISEWELLIKERGPKQLPLDVAIPFTILNVLLFISGLLGNIAVCIVIKRHSNMHTATNYYLFSLAVSDLTLLVFGVPNDVAVYWHQYPWALGEFCCKLRALLSEMASYVSVLTIVAFSTERYLSICYPLYLYTMSGLQRAKRIIFCLWLVSFVFALPFAIFTNIHYIEYPIGSGIHLEESGVCAMLHQPEYLPLAELSTLIFFVIPLLVMLYQYTRMGMKISNRSHLALGQNSTVHRDSRRSHTNQTVIWMLAAVVFCFFLCWAPFHAQRLIYMYANQSPYFYKLNEWMFYITGILYYLSSTLNPILYNVMSNKYRTAFREILCGAKRTNGSTLVRNSTMRETTRFPSHSNSERTDTRCAQNEEESMYLVHQQKEVIRVSSPKGKTSLLYELNYCDLKPNSETCI